MRHYLSALCLLFVSTCVFSTPAETPPEPALRIATPWPAQNAIIMMLGYGSNITGTSRVAKQIPLFRQMLPQIDNVPVIGTTGGNELNIEQILGLQTDILFIHDGIRVPQQEVLAQAGVRVLAFKANSMDALRERVKLTGVRPSAGVSQYGKPVVYLRAAVAQSGLDGSGRRGQCGGKLVPCTQQCKR